MQVLVWVMSYDGIHPPEPLAITAAAAALSLSGDIHAPHDSNSSGCILPLLLSCMHPIMAYTQAAQSRICVTDPSCKAHIVTAHKAEELGVLTDWCPCADIPLSKAVAGVRVGYIEGRGFVVAPTEQDMEESSLDLMLAGTADAVLMIEGYCDFLSEKQMLEVGLALDWSIKSLEHEVLLRPQLCSGLPSPKSSSSSHSS